MLGTVWYYFNDIYPPTHGNHRPLDPPRWWVRLWENVPEPEVEEEEPNPTGDEIIRNLNLPAPRLRDMQ
jgi:hypothetical protein